MKRRGEKCEEAITELKDKIHDVGNVQPLCLKSISIFKLSLGRALCSGNLAFGCQKFFPSLSFDF